MKWPNDLYIAEAKAGGAATVGGAAKIGGAAKVGGVIAETEAGVVVLGVGVNANVPVEKLPSAGFYRTASLLHETGAAVDIDDLLDRVLAGLGARVGQARDGGLAALLPEWRERSLEVGRCVTVERAGETIRGVVSDIGPDGSLQVETDRRTVDVAPHGDVSVVIVAPAATAEDSS